MRCEHFCDEHLNKKNCICNFKCFGRWNWVARFHRWIRAYTTHFCCHHHYTSKNHSKISKRVKTLLKKIDGIENVVRIPNKIKIISNDSVEFGKEQAWENDGVFLCVYMCVLGNDTRWIEDCLFEFNWICYLIVSMLCGSSIIA